MLSKMPALVVMDIYFASIIHYSRRIRKCLQTLVMPQNSLRLNSITFMSKPNNIMCISSDLE